MIFDFNQNTIKNFNFLKSIDNLVELYACSLEIPDFKNEYLTPLSKSNYLKGKNEIDYKIILDLYNSVYEEKERILSEDFNNRNIYNSFSIRNLNSQLALVFYF